MFSFRGPGLSRSLEEVEREAQAEAETETRGATCANGATRFHTEPAAMGLIKFI